MQSKWRNGSDLQGLLQRNRLGSPPSAEVSCETYPYAAGSVDLSRSATRYT